MNKPVHDTNNRSARSRPIGGESRFRIIFDAVSDGIFISDPATGRFIEVNKPGCRMFGYERAELIGGDIVMLSSGVHPYTQDGAIEGLRKARSDGPQSLEWHCKTKNGVLFWAEISLRYTEFGRIPAVVAIVRDITERRHASDYLREVQSALVEAQSIAHLGSWQFNLLTNQVIWSDECYRLFGVDRATFKPSFEAYLGHIHPDDRDALASALKRSLEDRTPYSLEQRIMRDDGTVRYVQQKWQNHYSASGKPLRVSGTVQDITERKTAENALIQERYLSAALIDSLPGLFVVLDERGSITRSNNNFSTMTGIANEELQGASAFEFVVESDRELLRFKLQEALTRGIANVEIGVNAKGGDVRTIHWSGRSVTTDGRPTLVAIGIDVTEQRTAEKRLRESEEKFHTVFDTMNDGIIVHDATTGSFTDVNRRACDMFGYSRDEMLKLDVGALGTGSGAYTREKAESNVKTAMANKSAGFEWLCKKKDGSQFWADVFIRCADIGDKPFVLSTAHDITERKQMLNDLGYRDKLLHAVTIATSELIAGESLEAGAQKAIATIGEAMKVDRIKVLEHTDEGRRPPLTRYYWQSPGSGLPPYGALPPIWGSATPEALTAWLAPMIQGKPVIAHARTAAAPIRELLESQNSKSVLLMPILSGAGPWGAIGIDTCKSEREWAKSDIEALAIFAEIIGIVTFRNGTRASLKKSEDRFRTVSHTAQDAIIIIDGAAKVSYWNPAAERIFGYTESEAIGRNIHEWLAPLRFREKAVAGMKEFAATGRGAVLGKTLELAAIRKDGTEIPIEISIADMREEASWSAVAMIRDITERKSAEIKLTRMARRDALTDLANRAVFVEELEREIAAASRGGKSFAILYLDLDHFKDVNDTLGHPVGDLLLQAVAQRLMAVIRKTDTVARFGGDEFALINANIGDPMDAVELAEKVLKTLSEPFSIQGIDIRSGASIGIAIYGPDALDSESLLSKADLALYRAKADGRGTYRFFAEAMDTEVRTRVRVAAELREAIASNQLFLMYQPQVNTETGKIIGLEALVRWQHPTRGIVLPGQFISIAERSGLIVQLGQWVLHEACRQMKEWRDAGIAPPLIAVNVSGLQFRTPHELEDEIAAILAETALPPGFLELEITETVLMEVSREHDDALQRIRDAGIRLAIDDFGTGYSSLEYLGRIPVNRIKIGQRFMPNLALKSHNGTIVKTAIGMAHELGLDVIIEGVETAEQLALVRSWSGYKIQGFYFSKPLSADEATVILRTGKIFPVRPVAIEAAAK